MMMRHLYSDPSNRHIPWEYICKVAIEKLRGEDIEPTLRSMRAALSNLSANPAK